MVDDWQKQYPSGRWVDPNAYIKASDSVEQSIEGFLLNGISYDMDERDVAWLDKHNSTAKGEGTSASAGSPDRLRAAKMRGKDVPVPEQPSFVITENEFELTMGLFEKFTDEKCPYLHLVSRSRFMFILSVFNPTILRTSADSLPLPNTRHLSRSQVPPHTILPPSIFLPIAMIHHYSSASLKQSTPTGKSARYLAMVER